MPVPNPADVVLRSRYRQTVLFPDLTERLALRLSSIVTYTARAHFGVWHKKMGGQDFTDPAGVFTPLVVVELEVTDVPVTPWQPFLVRGETNLAKTVDESGAVRRLIREGRHSVYDLAGELVARAKLTNVLTRYHPDPARRRITSLPPGWKLGEAPSRVTTLLDVDALVPADRSADFVEERERVWHYGHTDANRHVNSMEYLRSMEAFVADALHDAGQDLRRLYFARARIVYRKPCFRGEGYRRTAWRRGEDGLVVAGAFRKVADPPEARAAVAVELTMGQHAAP
jgi:hypothetical protein